MGIVISHYKDPYTNQRRQWNVRVFFRGSIDVSKIRVWTATQEVVAGFSAQEGMCLLTKDDILSINSSNSMID